MSDNDLACLYAKRWGVETKYLELKERLQIDKFSGSSDNIILQDIYSSCIYLISPLSFAMSRMKLSKSGQPIITTKYEQKANRAICIAALRRRFIDICLLDNDLKRDIALKRLFDD